MPIKGLTEIYRPPKVGMIRLGEKTVSKGKEHPKALHYFLVPDEIQPIVGEHPTELDVFLPSSDEEECFPQYYERWGGSSDPENARLLCQGDGETADCSDEDGASEKIECLGDECPYRKSKPQRCRRVARLMVILPDVPGLGVWQINTGSWHGTIDVNSMIRTLNKSLGRATGIPLKLSLEPKKVRPEGIPTTVFIMKLRCPALSYNQVKEIVDSGPRPLLVAPRMERPDDLVPVGARSDDGVPADVEQPEANERQVAGDREEVVAQSKKTAAAVKERPNRKPLF